MDNEQRVREFPTKQCDMLSHLPGAHVLALFVSLFMCVTPLCLVLFVFSECISACVCTSFLLHARHTVCSNLQGACVLTSSRTSSAVPSEQFVSANSLLCSLRCSVSYKRGLQFNNRKILPIFNIFITGQTIEGCVLFPWQ